MARKAKKEMQVQEFKKSNNLINTAYGRTSAMSYKLLCSVRYFNNGPKKIFARK